MNGYTLQDKHSYFYVTQPYPLSTLLSTVVFAFVVKFCKRSIV